MKKIREKKIEQLPEFDDHSIVSFIHDNDTRLRGFIAIHRGGIDTPALGATRLWPYKNDTDALRDVLKLSRIMSYKSALAGLPYGGAKGVIIARPAALKKRSRLLAAYARRVNQFRGGFVTGTDVGIEQRDIEKMRAVSEHIIGTKVDPASFTAEGLKIAMQTALEITFGSGDLTGRSIAIQGVGKVGSALLKIIAREAETIYIADIDRTKIALAKKLYPKTVVVSPLAIHKQKVDIFCPCAMSGTLSDRTVPALRAPIVVGGANNQLSHWRIGELLFRSGILYAPDYVVNAGGLISVADEYEHKEPDHERIVKKVSGIGERLKKIFQESQKKHCSTHAVAMDMAERIFNGG